MCNVGSFSVLLQNLVNHLSKKYCNLWFRTSEGWEFLCWYHQQLKQAEPVTSPLCPERCIIIIVGWVDRCRPYYIILPFVFVATFPWRMERLSSILPRPCSCYASLHIVHNITTSRPVKLEIGRQAWMGRCCQRMCCDGHSCTGATMIGGKNSHKFHFDIGRRDYWHFKPFYSSLYHPC